MSQPTIYFPAFSFTSYQSTHPTDPLPGNSVDNELFTIAQSIAQICQNLKLIQRDDGQLANLSVGAAQLQAAISIGLNNVTTWVTVNQYYANNFVYAPDGDVYQCAVSHISGTFSVDLSNGKWVLVLSFAAATTAATNSSVSATASASSATAAAASATAAANSANNLTGTSVTSQSIATGAKTFTTQAGLFFPVGSSLNITSNANPTVNNLFGTVTSYSGTSLVMNITVANGTSTHTDWTITLSGARGATGPAGSPGPGTGDMLAANNLSDVASVSTARTNLGLGAAAQQANSFFCQTANNLSDVTAATARTNLAVLGKAANLSDVASNVTALTNLFGSTPVIPSGATGTTQATSDNSTKLATTAYVKAQTSVLASALGVGAYTLATYNAGALSAGTSLAGSNIQPCSSNYLNNAVATDTPPSGTWRCMQSVIDNSSVLWLRIA